jgi:Spy/CpxP family protein refolding chaperone
MKSTPALISSVIGLILLGNVPLSMGKPGNPPPANREEIRRQLRELPPEERRALIKELREQKSPKPDKSKPGGPPADFRREEVSREMKNLPPEERRARLRELRGLPPEPREGPQPDFRRPADRELPRGDRPPMAGQPGRFAPMFDRVLSEDQRASFREAMESHRGELRELEEKLRAARRELFQAGVGREFNEEAVRDKAMAAARLETELTVLRARMLSRVKPSLSPRQLEQLQNPMGLEGNAPRPDFRREDRREDAPRGDRPGRGPRDENDLPPRPRSER